jgi:GWxTD domain-containing protein
MNLKLINKILLLIIFMSFSLALHSEQNPTLAEKYKNWIENEVVYIITPKEKEVFHKLESDRERELFIAEFWEQRDPTPGTLRNEFKDEHFRRIEYANRKFAKGVPFDGWRTDRGRFYIILGRPFHVERFATTDTHPIEIWYYHGNPSLGQAPTFRLLFFQRGGSGEFELYDPMADGPKSLVPFTQRTHEFFVEDPDADSALRIPGEQDLLTKLKPSMEKRDVDAYMILHYNTGIDLAEASLSNIPGRWGPEQRLPSVILIRDVETYPHKKVDDEYAYEFLEHKEIVEVSYSVHYMGNLSKVSVLQDPSGVFFVNFIIVPDSMSVDLYNDKYVTNIKESIRLTDTREKTIFQGERTVPIELRKQELKMLEKSSFHLFDSFPLISGDYKFAFLLENTVTKEFTSFEKNISVPEIGALQMSTLTFARKVNRDSPYSQEHRSFQLGNLQIYPSVNNTFLSQDTLYLFFQIYGLNPKLKEEGLLEYVIYSEGKVVQTKRRNIDEYATGRDFLEEISLDALAPGIYTIEVSLIDQEKQRLLSERDVFSITTKAFPGTWIVAQTNPPAGDPYYPFVLGNQYLMKGDVLSARDNLAKAHAGKPDSLDYALNYTRVLITLKEYEKVRDILLPFEKEGKVSFGLFYTLGKASMELDKFEDAIIFYQSALSQRGDIVEVLNAIGECYLNLGNLEQTLRAWDKSLEINPKQLNLKKRVKDLREKK